MRTIKGGLVVLLFCSLVVFVFVSPDFAQGNNSGFVLPPDPGKAGKVTLLGIDTDGDGVRDDIQRYIYFTYPDDKKLRLGLTYYAIEFQGVLKDANDREAAYDHANKMARHGEAIIWVADLLKALHGKNGRIVVPLM